jgi:hypothetical protein
MVSVTVSYKVKLKRSSANSVIAISFDFDKPAEGRGVGTSRGEVRRVRLELPRSTAQALSHALQLALSDTASTELELKIDEVGTA